MGDRLGKLAGSAPDATRNSATDFPRSSAVPAGASAWNEDGRWTGPGQPPARRRTGRSAVAARDVVVVGASAGGVEALRDGDLVRFRCRVGASWGDVARDDEYVDCLQLHPDEFTALFNTILINVTNFLPRQRRRGAAAHPAAPRAAAPPRPDRADSARSHPVSGLAAADAAGLRLRPTRDPPLETASVTSSVSERATPGRSSSPR